ncbi:hypothetical protein GU927_013535 [Rhodobacteraceae bacterium HSP-20]|uniref:Uncharacterized protein n=1 Tax=Paragemmobacter amnigenus TaxID=2852097 RepID=A0ABS6J5I4_9RHOB|nr:hypothetical protein [Rhodobacter amnigenus]MBU9698868.1 hypothetical protein [Rhodobacter amnigenus]MBV4390095.1 hypothetical protein [Rhodobacter amnigenus]
MRSIMMTCEGVAKLVAAQLVLDKYFAQVLPGQKAAKVRDLCARASRSPWSVTGSTNFRRWSKPILASPSAQVPDDPAHWCRVHICVDHFRRDQRLTSAALSPNLRRKS